MDGPSAQGFLGLTGPLAPRVVDCPSGNAYEVSVTDLPFSVIWHEKHSADWLAALAFPYPALPDFHLKVKRLTMICASLAFLQITFAVHPRESVSHDSQVASLPYESCSLATPMQGSRIKHREAPLRKRLCNKHGLLCHRLRGKGGGASHQRGIAFPRPQGGCTVFPAAARQHLYWRP